MITVNCSPEVDLVRTLKIIGEIRSDPMAGWVDLPRRIDMGEFARVKEAARKIREESEYLVCIGIGGSYLGHRAIIEALQGDVSGASDAVSVGSEVKIVYAGNSLSRRELNRVLDEVGDHDFSVNVISKSGTTLEPAIAFEAFKRKLVEKYGAEEAASRIYATTDATRGTLHDEAVAAGYTRFIVPDDIGGRYSVLTAVGLLPMCVAGVDIDQLLEGASEISRDFAAEQLVVNTGRAGNNTVSVKDASNNITSAGITSENFAMENVSAGVAALRDNPVVCYAWMRYLLGQRGV